MAKGNKVRKPVLQEPEVYHVEVITKARVVPLEDEEIEDSLQVKVKKSKRDKKKKKPAAKWEYFVKWAGYDSDANSWEPEENVAGCQRLLQSFWAHVGTDDDDYEIGYEVAAKESWIKKEIAYFAAEFSGVQDDIRDATKEEGNSKNTTRDHSQSKGKSISQPPLLITIPGKKRKREPIVVTDDDDLRKKNKRLSIGEAKSDFSSNKGKQKAVQPESLSPSSLFSELSSPELPLSTLSITSEVTKKQSTSNILTKSGHISNSRPSLPELSVNVGSIGVGISTKQRLSMGALAPVIPKTASAIKNISFKKKPASPVRNNETTDSPVVLEPLNAEKTLASLNARPLRDSSPAFRTPGASVDAINTQSLAGFGMNEQLPLFSNPFFEEANTMVVEQPPTIDPMMFQAENFLREIMPPALAAPLDLMAIDNEEILPPLSLSRKKVTTRIPKKWKWEGPLIIQSNGIEIQTIKILLIEVSDLKLMSMGFRVAMAPLKELRTSNLCDATVITRLLSAFKSSSQIGQVSPLEQTDNVRFEALEKQIELREKVIFIPISLDEHVVAHIILFPKSMISLCRLLNISMDMQTGIDGLISAILPRSLSKVQYIQEPRFAPVSIAQYNPLLPAARWIRAIRTKPHYQRALRILNFPKDLHDFLADGRERSFCIWWESSDGTRKNPGLETMALYSIMEQCRAKNVGRGGDWRVAFVHIGALHTLHELSKFRERRLKPHVRFYAYGTSQDVNPNYWNIQEIYKRGGIVNIGPSALLDDLLNVLHKISQISRHFFWDCYILPLTLGMLAKLVCENENPLEVFDRGKFMLQPILTAIEEGEISLFSSPPIHRSISKNQDLTKDWIIGQTIGVLCFDARSILDTCIRAFDEKFAKIDKSQWVSEVEKEIEKDMWIMQRQPMMMVEYRRYVVFAFDHDSHDKKYGLEWVSPSAFDFKDEIYPDLKQ